MCSNKEKDAKKLIEASFGALVKLGARIRQEFVLKLLKSALKLPQPTISHHVGLLDHAGVLERCKKGKFVFYKLNVSQ